MPCSVLIRRIVSPILLVWALVGCGAPRSVDRLIDQAARAVEAERRLLERDLARAEALLAERRAALADGFEADLAARQTIDRDWVGAHARAYAAAREAVLRDALARESELATRRANLGDALRAQRLAADLVATHRRLFDPITRRLDMLTPTPTPTPEPEPEPGAGP